MRPEPGHGSGTAHSASGPGSTRRGKSAAPRARESHGTHASRAAQAQRGPPKRPLRPIPTNGLVLFSLLGAAIAIVATAALAMPGVLPGRPAAPVHLETGDAGLFSLSAYDPSTGVLVWSSPSPVQIFEGNGSFQGIASRFLNETAGTSVDNLTLAPWDAAGNGTPADIVKVARVETVQRVEIVSLDALDQAVGHYVQTGEVVQLPSWRATVIQVDQSQAVLRADPPLGSIVHYYQYWPSTVLNITGSTLTVRNDPVANSTVQITQDDGATVTARIDGLDANGFSVNWNPLYTGRVLDWSASLVLVEKNTTG
ncbi:MAG: hypothetical protein ACYDDF_12250 [Thermoplasmatota archaeon]